MKVWAGQLSRWIDREFIKRRKNGVNQGAYVLEPERFDRCSSLIFQEGDEILEKTNTTNDQQESHSVKQKDYSLSAYLGVGLFLTLIGYFGWLERTPRMRLRICP